MPRSTLKFSRRERITYKRQKLDNGIHYVYTPSDVYTDTASECEVDTSNSHEINIIVIDSDNTSRCDGST